MTATTPLFDRPAIGVHQVRKLMEMRNRYRLVDEDDQPVGTVEQENQSSLTFLTRFFSDLDVALPMHLVVRDAAGRVVLVIDKPWFTWRMSVESPQAGQVASITKQVRLGKARFSVTAPDGTELGEIQAKNWRAKDFSITNARGTEVAHVGKQWRGMVTEAFTDADSYVVSFSPQLEEPYRSVAFAAALVVDIVMKQKDT